LPGNRQAQLPTRPTRHATDPRRITRPSWRTGSASNNRTTPSSTTRGVLFSPLTTQFFCVVDRCQQRALLQRFR
jgi:hypothetical protein